MKKCKCIKESSWFLIDDSFDEDSKTKGGKFLKVFEIKC